VGDLKDETGNALGIAGQIGQGLEGFWRGGLGHPELLPDGRPVMDAEALEMLGGVASPDPNYNSMIHGAPNGGGWNALGILGTMGSAFGMVTGAMDMLDPTKSTGDRAVGGGNAGTGLIGTIGGLANGFGVSAATGTGLAAGAQNLLYGMTSLGGAGMGGGGMAGGAGAASTWFGTAAGGAGAGTAAGVGTALSTGAAVVGAGLGGYGLGSYGDANMKNLDWLRDDKGKNRSISDWGSDLAVDAEEGVTNFIGGEKGSTRSRLGGRLGTALGYTTAGLTSLAGVPLAVGSALNGADNFLGGVPSKTLAAMTGGVSTQVGKGMGAAVDFANWLTD